MLGELVDDHPEFERPLPDADLISHLENLRPLGPLAAHLDLPAGDGAGGQCAGLVEASGPQPLVEPDSPPAGPTAGVELLFPPQRATAAPLSAAGAVTCMGVPLSPGIMGSFGPGPEPPHAPTTAERRTTAASANTRRFMHTSVQDCWRPHIGPLSKIYVGACEVVEDFL